MKNHKGTRDFLNALFRLSMFPLIDRPNRITEYSATLIDNILVTIYMKGLVTDC